jgi:hypothetical protein
MKVSTSALLLISLGLLSVTTSFAQSTVPKAERKLKLREDGTFTMIQLTDIHYGE